MYQVPVYYTSTPVPAPVYQYTIYTTAGPIWSILCTMYQYKYNVPVSTPVQLRDQWSILCTRESGPSSSMKEAAKYSLNIEVYCIFLVKWNIFALLFFTFVGEWKSADFVLTKFPPSCHSRLKTAEKFYGSSPFLDFIRFLQYFWRIRSQNCVEML